MEIEEAKEEALQFLNFVTQKPTQIDHHRQKAALIIQKAWKKYYVGFFNAEHSDILFLQRID